MFIEGAESVFFQLATTHHSYKPVVNNMSKLSVKRVNRKGKTTIVRYNEIPTERHCHTLKVS